jgi:serine/threonine protein kinase
MSLRMNLHDIELIRTIGRGTYSTVKLAILKKTQQYIVIKILKKSDMIRLKQVDHVISEYSILRSISHSFCVSLVGFSQDSSYLYIAQEFVQGGELFRLLRSSDKFDVIQTKYYSAMIVLILEYLHSKKIIYRDLKLENLLLDNLGYLKLVDFGFAKKTDSRTFTLCGTPEYMAPEILLNRGHSKAVDWWALGIIIYEMLTGNTPFYDEDPMTVYNKILKQRVRFTKSFNSNARSLVRHLVEPDLSKRYGNLLKGPSDVKGHRWFEGLNWERLLRRTLEMPYIPRIRGPSDASSYPTFSEKPSRQVSVSTLEDPFIQW